MAVSVIAVMCVLLFLGCFYLTKERVKPINENKSSLKSDIKDLFHNRPWWILFGAAVYYFKYYIVEEEFRSITLFGVSFVLSGLFLSIGQMANIIGVVLAAPVSNIIGKKQTFAISMSLAAVLSIIFYWFKPGLIFSASSMSQKFGWAIGTAVTGWLLSFFGFQANEVQSPEAINGIKMFLSILPAIAALVSVLFVCFYPLGENKVKVIISELNLKRENKK